jgi:tyrosyl-tRNA synthetase
MRSKVASGELHPMQVKKDLALQIVGDFHSGKEAQDAEQNWAKQFQRNEVPSELPESEIPSSQVTSNAVPGSRVAAIRMDKLLVACGFAASSSEAQRKIKEKAVYVEDRLVESATFAESLPNPFVVRLGKRMMKIRLRAE